MKKIVKTLISILSILLIFGLIKLSISEFWRGEFAVVQITDEEVIPISFHKTRFYTSNLSCYANLQPYARSKYDPELTLVNIRNLDWLQPHHGNIRSYRIVCNKKSLLDLFNIWF